MILIENINLYDYDHYLENGYILFDEKIVEVGTMEDFHKKDRATALNRNGLDKRMDGKGKFLLPGLVLGHTHIYSAFARGWITPFNPHSFEDILKQMWWKLDRALDLEMIYGSGLMAGQNFLKQGVTTVIDHHASGTIKGSLNALAKAIVGESKMRGIFCFETSDRFDVDACIEENMTFSQSREYDRNYCRGLFGMHASFTLSDASLQKIASAKADLPIHIHVAESREDVEWTKTHTGGRIIDRLDRFGLLGEDNLYAHGLFLEEDEFLNIVKTKGNLVINPTSNMNNGVGLPPIRQINEHNVPLMIGNDGLGFGVVSDIKQSYYVNQLAGFGGRGLEGVRQSIKANYAYASRQLQIPLGTFAIGAAADFVLVDYVPMTPIHKDNILGHVFFGMMDQWQPEKVIIGGTTVYPSENREKEQDIQAFVDKQARRLWAATETGGHDYGTE